VSKDKLRLICRCGTVWPVCEMPVAIEEMATIIHFAKCPSCDRSAKTACVYVETFHERGTELQDSKPVE
jgi:hypothetical protein